jgi:ABC-2 type transport system permease protein
MHNIWVIAKREYKQYFESPVAYMVAFMLLLVLGIFFALSLVFYSGNAYQFNGVAPDVSIVTEPFSFMLVLSLPALTMRLLAEEQRLGTMELLMTAPVREWELVVGKWLGSLLFMLTVIGITLIFPLILQMLIFPGIDWGRTLTAYLGIVLVTASFLSVGVGVSALFKNQVAAFFATLAVFVLLWFLIGFPGAVFPKWASVFRYLDMKSHFYNSMNVGMFALSDLVYYLSLIVLGLFVGSAAIETRRWR